MLIVPLFDRAGELVAYFSVDDPADRLVPSRETVELLEIFGNHAVVAIENARLYPQLEAHTRELEEAGQRMQEIARAQEQLRLDRLARAAHAADRHPRLRRHPAGRAAKADSTTTSSGASSRSSTRRASGWPG